MTASTPTWSHVQNSVVPPSLDLAVKYDAVAHRWQRTIQHLGYLQAYKTIFLQLQKTGLLPHSGRLLDCGIGSGALSQALLSTIAGAWAVEGVDISTNMLHEATMRLRTAAASLHMYCTDVSRLPQADNNVDVVISAHMIEHLPDPATGLREMVRVLKPGAPMLLLVTCGGLIGSLIRQKWQIHCVKSEEMLQQMQTAGLVNVQVIPQTAWWLPCSWSSIAYVGVKR